MIRSIRIPVLPAEATNPDLVRSVLLSALGIPTQQLSGYRIRKRSIDARHRSVRVILTIDAYIDEPLSPEVPIQFEFPVLKPGAKKVVIVGAGPAGLFAALKLIQSGIQPIIIERGKDVRSRRRDLAALNKQGQVDPDSNYCFGEGGAGTYSDGKLYTRSNKRGSIDKILRLFYQFGADESILYQAHPHIGTNKLPHIITAMREQIEASGGKVLFN